MARFFLMEAEGGRMKKFISLVRFSSVKSHSKLLINVGDVKTLFFTCLTFSLGFFRLLSGEGMEGGARAGKFTAFCNVTKCFF